MNTKCQIHGNEHPDFACPDKVPRQPEPMPPLSATPYDQELDWPTLEMMITTQETAELKQEGYRRALADQAAAVPLNAELTDDEIQQVIANHRQRGWLFKDITDRVIADAATAKATRYWETEVQEAYELAGEYDEVAKVTGTAYAALVTASWSARDAILSHLDAPDLIDALDNALAAVKRGGEDTCHAQQDGDCYYRDCPQITDNEPKKSGRHCPWDRTDDRSN